MKKVNKSGFTLVELLAVIVLMAVLVTIAVPGITRIGKSLKVQSFCSKINIIESAALEYANDYYVDKETTTKTTLDNVSLMDLINMNYLKSDNDIKSSLSSTEQSEKKKGKQFCLLYDKTSNCLVDPRDNTSMDYKLVKIWSENKRIYASFLYSNNDASNQICGNTIKYEKDTTNSNFTKTYPVTGLGDFTAVLKPTKVMENGNFNWTNYKTFRITRKDGIPGNYYIKSVSVKYALTSNTQMELNIGNYHKQNNITSSGSNTFNLSGKNLNAVDISYRVALRGKIRDNNASGKVTEISVTWAALA